MFKIEIQDCNLDNVKPEFFISNNVHRCPKCKYFTKSTYGIKHHLLRHNLKLEPFGCGKNTVEAFSCNLCEFKTHLQVCFIEHLKETHRNEAEEQNFELNTYICQKCSFQTFSSLIWLKHHECLLNHKLKSFDPQLNCDQCSYKTHKEHSLKNHVINEHLPERPKNFFNHFYSCDKCNYGVYKAEFLEKHIKITHPPEEYKKWFKCAQCDFKTKYSHYLKLHIWKEHRKRICKCDQCDFTTTVVDNLRVHILRRHTSKESIEWFHCDQCDYKSMIPRYVRYHKNSKHGRCVHWLRCDQCEFKSKSAVTIARHKRKKHNEACK